MSPSRVARRRSGRRPGKQPGAGGSALFQTSDPDEVIDHVPDACGGCGSDLTNASLSGVVRRQVHDIPVITPIVVEHRLHRRRCGCGATTTVTAPAGVSAAAAYGPSTATRPHTLINPLPTSLSHRSGGDRSSED